MQVSSDTAVSEKSVLCTAHTHTYACTHTQHNKIHHLNSFWPVLKKKVFLLSENRWQMLHVLENLMHDVAHNIYIYKKLLDQSAHYRQNLMWSEEKRQNLKTGDQAKVLEDCTRSSSRRSGMIHPFANLLDKHCNTKCLLASECHMEESNTKSSKFWHSIR